MADLREKLDKLRADAADLVLMSRRSSDPQKRALFERLADELAIEALELEQVVKQTHFSTELSERRSHGRGRAPAACLSSTPTEGATVPYGKRL